MLLEFDHTEQSSEITVGPGGEEKLVDGAVLAESVAKFNSPELVDVDYLVIGVFQGADELAGYGVESVDGAAVGVVRNQ